MSIRRSTTLNVLDHLSRLVDDSLQEARSGARRVIEHYQFVTTDSRFAHDDSKKWLAWCHSAGGNILHACALWNDVVVATEVVDGDGRPPYEVAQLSGHDSALDEILPTTFMIFSAWRNNRTKSSTRSTNQRRSNVHPE
jgi:hypothetical protein